MLARFCLRRTMRRMARGALPALPILPALPVLSFMLNNFPKLDIKNAHYFAAAVFAAAAYLSLVNLGYAPLWHDEAPLAVTAKNIVETGGYNGWDGRNLFMTQNAASVNKNLKLVSYPPWQALPSALGILFFGANEVGVRVFHAVLGLASLVLFWLLLRMDFLHRPRLRLIAFTLFALSAQTILFFRQGRYAADAIFFALLLFYSYRLYIAKNGNLNHLAAAAAAAVLGFLNHFAVGGAFALALAAWHLLFYGRATSRLQWRQIALAGAISGAICFAYLLLAGIILSDEKLEFGSVKYELPWLKRKAYLIYYNFRDLLRFDWLPLWLAAWFVFYIAMLVYHVYKRGLFKLFKKSKKNKKKKDAPPLFLIGDTMEHTQAVIRWGALLVLFLFFSGLLALRPVAIHPFADSRYVVPALPITAFLVAVCLDWLWKQRLGVWAAAPLLAIFLISNALSYPYIHKNFFSEETLRFTLPRLVREIHRPYPSYVSDAATFLRQNAAQDDTVYVQPWQDFAVLQFYLTDKLIFCCAIDENSGLAEETVRKLGVPLYRGDVLPVWYVVVGGGEPDTELYQLVYSGETYGYPTQRPELEFHAFEPLPGRGHLRIYRRK